MVEKTSDAPRFGRGWRPDDVKFSGTLVERRYAAAGPIPRQWHGLLYCVASADANALPTLDQGNTSRCVAFSGAEAAWTRLAWLGLPRKLLDIRQAYTAAQRWEQRRNALGRQQLQDHGLHPIDFLQSTGTWGTNMLADVSRSTLDRELDPGRVLEDVWLADYQAAATHKITGWRRLEDETHPDVMIEKAKRFAYAGFPGLTGFDLDGPFEEYQRGVWTRDPARASEGLHALSGPYGWDDDAKCFDYLNHWGSAFGDRGIIRVSYATYASKFASDRVHLEAVPYSEDV